ncbi:MAG TPA: hypothetical protein VND62_09320 [Acidimicrobiales bacterium]|nr:hypothetical protein [Acidimicrobiales bacterium]
MPRARSSPSPRSSSPPAAPSHLERTTEWSGVRAGDPVEVAGLRARSASWTFLAHVRNVRTGEEWVEVVGGRPGSRAVRSFRSEQILPPSARPARGTGRAGGSRAGRAGRAPAAPLADAPRLPI